jgi:hypothetical protein
MRARTYRPIALAIGLVVAGCTLDLGGMEQPSLPGDDAERGAIAAGSNADAAVLGGQSGSVHADASSGSLHEGGTSSGAGSSTTSSGGAGSGASKGDGGGSGAGEGGAGSGSGGVTCLAPAGGASCDPGKVPCGSSTCDTSKKSCCQVSGDGGADICIGPNGSCMGAKVACKETGDCVPGLVCCGVYGATSCLASCGGPSGFQVCRSHTECGANSDAGALANKCILQTCGGMAPPGGGPPSPVVTVEACAVQSSAGQGAPPTWGPLPGCVAK